MPKTNTHLLRVRAAAPLSHISCKQDRTVFNKYTKTARLTTTTYKKVELLSFPLTCFDGPDFSVSDSTSHIDFGAALVGDAPALFCNWRLVQRRQPPCYRLLTTKETEQWCNLQRRAHKNVKGRGVSVRTGKRGLVILKETPTEKKLVSLANDARCQAVYVCAFVSSVLFYWPRGGGSVNLCPFNARVTTNPPPPSDAWLTICQPRRSSAGR